MLNLLVIRSKDIEQSRQFYELLGLNFEPHQHGQDAPHFAAEQNGFVFEIYPCRGKDTTATRFGFGVNHLEATFDSLIAAGAQVVSAPQDSPWGKRAVIKAPDGHTVELMAQ